MLIMSKNNCLKMEERKRKNVSESFPLFFFLFKFCVFIEHRMWRFSLFVGSGKVDQ